MQAHKSTHASTNTCMHTHTHSHMYLYLCRTDSSVVGEEGGRTVFLTVSRSNGLEAAVSVEWETQSDTAIAMGKMG